jgi:hypothetical protein
MWAIPNWWCHRYARLVKFEVEILIANEICLSTTYGNTGILSTHLYQLRVLINKKLSKESAYQHFVDRW